MVEREGEEEGKKKECLSAFTEKFAEDQSDYRSRGGRRVKSGETRHDRTREGPARDSAAKK